MSGYDVLYQKWLTARQAKDYGTADAIREIFEREYCLTIFAEGLRPVEGITVKRMKASAWEKKYGNPVVGQIISTEDSKVKKMFPAYTGLKKL